MPTESSSYLRDTNGYFNPRLPQTSVFLAITAIKANAGASQTGLASTARRHQQGIPTLIIESGARLAIGGGTTVTYRR